MRRRVSPIVRGPLLRVLAVHLCFYLSQSRSFFPPPPLLLLLVTCGTIMYIEQLEVHNFKSFTGTTVIPFRQGFTTISGPNGSGKSNIIDSILFCLGLSSSRSMRAERLTDLINNRIQRSHREAWVQISFIDPATGDKLLVGRKIRQNPQGYTSTYTLNNKNSSLTEIHEHLARYHVSPGCYNVMMQGDVAGIVNMPPGERRKILDELAGVAEFDRKIELAEKELTSAQDAIDKQRLLMSEIDERLISLEKEKEKAVKYRELRERRSREETRLKVLKSRWHDGMLVRAQEQIAQLRETRRADTQRLKDTEKRRFEAQNHLETLARTFKEQGEQQLLTLKSQHMSLSMHIERRQQGIVELDQQVRQLDDQRTRLERQIAETHAWLKEAETEEQTFSGRKQALEQERKEALKELESLTGALKGVQEAFARKQAERDALQAQVRVQQERVASLEQERLGLEAELVRVSDRHSEQKRRLDQLALQEAALSDRLKAVETQQTQIADALSAEEDTLTGLKQRMAKCDTESQGLRDALGQYKDKLLQAEARKRAVDEVTFARAVETVLRENLPGVHGTVAQLCSALDEAHATALEVAFGNRLQNVVVADDRVAQTCIQLLKQRSAGRVTFLPLNKIRGYSVPNSLPGSGGVVDFALNLISFDPQYETIFSFCLGDTLIVETLDDGRRLLGRHRMVTLDGSLLEKSGAMTGGSLGGPRGGQRLIQVVGLHGVVGKDDAEASIDELRRQVQELEASVRKRLELYQADSRRLDESRQRHQQFTQQHLRCQTTREELEQQLAALAQQRDAVVQAGLQAASQANQADASPIQAKLNTIQATIGQERQNLEGLLAKLNHQLAVDGQQPVSEEMSAFEAKNEEVRALQEMLTELEASFQKTRSEMGFRRASLKDYDTQLAEKAVEKDTLLARRIEWEEDIARTEGQREAMAGELAAMEEKLKGLQDERQAAQQQLLDLEREKADIERQQVLKEEQILSWQARQRELEATIGEVKQALAEEGLTPDTHPAFQEPEPTQEALDQLVKALEGMTRQLTAMEPVNMLAIEEYDHLKARSAELNEKVDTLSVEREDILARIEGHETLKRESFMKAFDHVNQEFQTIFAELSDGEGRLVLTQPDDPLHSGLTIEAQPRGKKVQRLESMSGGEKSLTSLAFVFSLQRYNPAPFYALDEVDMNLDGINAEKLARMVQRESRKAQFLVVSLRKPMLQSSDQTIGVTQRRDGYTKVTGVQGLGEDAPEHESTEASPPLAKVI